MGTRTYDRGVVVATTAMTAVHRIVDRLTRGRLGRRLGGAEVVWLTVKGRRSGKPQRVPLVCSRGTSQGLPRFLVAGSRGGTEKSPAWALNLRGHLDRDEPARLQVADEHLEVHVRELAGEERDAGYAEMVRTYKGFANYERSTERVIPVFELIVRTPPAA